MLIELTIRRHGLGRMISEFCRIAEVSRAGYYDWLKAADKRILLEESDYMDYELTLKIFEAKKRKAGAKTLRMDMENDYSAVMNLKKIHRLMNKYESVAKV
ncbi:hypothetical protein [Sporosarcina sp. resist]|uniref:hypothetical protein n=1 Tax=Sporosarcina sp. resist TaxID=2762563 RepID=UPI00351C895B